MALWKPDPTFYPCKASPFVPHTDSVRGFVFDVAAGRLREVGAEAAAPAAA